MQRSNPEIAAKYHSNRWEKLRRYKKTLSPFCEECLKRGVYTPTYIVHHKEWINEDNYFKDEVFYNIDNLESVCLECHNKIHFEKEKDYYFDRDGNIVKKKNQAPTQIKTKRH